MTHFKGDCMADTKIRGISIKLDADTTGIQKSMQKLDSNLKQTQSNLKDINRLLKFDPGNTELLTQKQKNLESAISNTEKRIEELKKAQEGVKEGSQEWDAIEREIIANEQSLKRLKQEYRDFGSVASQQIKNVGQSLQDAGGRVQDFGKKLAPVSAAAAAIGTGLLKLGYDAVTSADDLNTLSKQTGISTDELQKMQYAADLVDVSVDDITGALRKLKPKLTDDNEALAKLGVSATNADGSLRDATDVFYDTLDALSKVDNETERDQLAMELFGKGADSLAGIIDDGGAALREYGQQAEDLGLILGEDTLNSLNETNDTIDQLKANITGTMAQVGAKVVPVLVPLIQKVGDLIGRVSERLRALTPEQTETILKIVGVVAALAPVITIGGKLISGLGSIISVIGTVVGVLGGPLTIAIGAIIAIGVLLYKNWDTVKEYAIRLKDGVVTAWNNIKTKISGVIDAIRAKIDGLKQKFEDLKTKVQNIWESIKNFFTGGFQLPHIPLPHFGIDPPGWKFSDLFQGSIPRLNIEWYKKAYDNPVMFTSPTVMATPNGLKGFGDGHGAEIVMGLDKLREVVGSAGGVTINVYPSPGMNEEQLARRIQDIYVANARQRGLLNA